jgi:hypothetical protein
MAKHHRQQDTEAQKKLLTNGVPGLFMSTIFLMLFRLVGKIFLK